MPTPVTRRPSFEGAGEVFPSYHQMGGAKYEGPSALEEMPRQYLDFLFPGGSTHSAPAHQHSPKGYSTAVETGAHFPGTHYARAHLLAEQPGYGVQRSPSFQSKTPPDAYSGLAKAQGGPPASLSFPAHAGLYTTSHHKPAAATPGAHPLHVLGARGPTFAGESPTPAVLPPSRNSLNADLYELGSPVPWSAAPLTRRDSMQKQGLESSRPHVAFRAGPSRTNSFSSPQPEPSLPAPSLPAPNTVTTVTAAHILHPVKSVRVLRPEPQTAVGPSHPAWVPGPTAPATTEGLETKEGNAGQHPLDVDYGGSERRCPPPPYPKHLLLPSKAEQYNLDVDSLCTGVEQSLRTSAEQDRNDKSHKGAKGDKASRDKKQIQTSPVPVRKNSKDEEKRESRIKSYSPFAFKFYMEQHVENVIKTYQQKVSRRLQLEQEMAKVISHFLLSLFSAPSPL